MDIGEAVRITKPTPRVHEAFRRLRERGHVAFVCTGRPICLIYLFTAFAAYIANPALAVKTAGGDNVIVYALTCALSFVVGVTIVYNGVRMILADLVPAFQGISNKLIPDAIPAVDCAVFFPYAPTTVILAILIVVAFAPNFIKTKGAVINHVEEE